MSRIEQMRTPIDAIVSECWLRVPLLRSVSRSGHVRPFQNFADDDWLESAGCAMHIWLILLISVNLSTQSTLTSQSPSVKGSLMLKKHPRIRKDPVAKREIGTFTSADFLAHAGLGRKIVEFNPKDTFFSQGDPADAIFYLQRGRAKLTVVSGKGKEATISLLSAGDFVGEESLAAIPGLRLATASAVNTCTALKITREEMSRVLNDEPSFADLFLKFMLSRSMRTQADLVDQLFNSSEKRLARILLLMAEFSKPGEHDACIPPISQETLAGMIGTTRSRVSFFMNRFRKLGFIEYNGRIKVNKSLLNVVLLDQFPGHNSQKPPISIDAVK